MNVVAAKQVLEMLHQKMESYGNMGAYNAEVHAYQDLNQAIEMWEQDLTQENHNLVLKRSAWALEILMSFSY